MTGFHDIDQYIQSQLLVAALDITLKTIKPGGIFISKFFKGHDTTFITSQFKVFFKQVDILKPKSSRESSAEHFIVCRFFEPPQNFGLSKLSTFYQFDDNVLRKEGKESEEVKKENERVYNYVTRGDLSTYDE